MKSSNMFRLLLIAVVPLLSAGCAVLTRSQVKEVNTFATVAENYGTLPGDSIRAYGQATRFDRLLNISARDFRAESARTEGWVEIEKALDVESSFLGTAAQADAALDVLDDYTALLKLVSSDEFTTELENSAKQLGTSIDKGIGVYNDKFRLPAGKAALQPAGAAVAAVIRGAGGIYLRARQAKMLRDAVTSANPMVCGLAADVASLMSEKMQPYLTQVSKRLGDDFETAAARAQKLPLSTIEAVSAQVEQIRKGQALAQAAAKAADRLAAAHQKLARELTSRKTIKDRIEEIQALADEIKAAQKLQKAMKQ